jgi:rod shape-determining protein MreB and related proteins
MSFPHPETVSLGEGWEKVVFYAGVMRQLLRTRAIGLGIDLGTTNTLICDQDRRILLNEPSAVALDKRAKKVVAVGAQARRMLGRTPDNLEVVMPLRDGIIDNYDLTCEMLRSFLRQVRPGLQLLGSRIVICVPTETTQIERRAVREAGQALRSSQVYVVEEPMAAACGVDLPVSEARGSMIVDIGGGTTEIAVISYSGIVCSGSVRIGGTHLDEAIAHFIRRRYNLLIGTMTAESLKIELGSAELAGRNERSSQVRGRDLVRQLPRLMSVPQKDVVEAMSEPIGMIMDSIKKTLERTPPELAADVVDRGIVLTGGGALMQGMRQRVERETGIPTHVAENPLLAVAHGAARLLKDEPLLDRICVRSL